MKQDIESQYRYIMNNKNKMFNVRISFYSGNVIELEKSAKNAHEIMDVYQVLAKDNLIEFENGNILLFNGSRVEYIDISHVTTGLTIQGKREAKK